MKNRVFVFSSILLGASLAASAQTSTPTKIGIINIQQAIVSTNDGQKAIKELEAKSAPKKKELEKVQAEISGLRDQLSKLGSVGSEEQKRKLMSDIDQKTKTFNRDVEDAQAELDQDQNRVLNELGGRLLAVLDKYAKDNGYAVILDVSSQQSPVLFAANSVEVTRDVVEMYNKNAPAAGAAPAGGAAAPGAGAPASSKPAGTPAPSAVKPAPPKTAPAK
ncbi:MAG TPA: OmpH family outer membrane protein [Bryobacteraceae bacterium]|nr:OmpH family outer membrane protein [Bryobacteraceae bacterium]